MCHSRVNLRFWEEKRRASHSQRELIFAFEKSEECETRKWWASAAKEFSRLLFDISVRKFSVNHSKYSAALCSLTLAFIYTQSSMPGRYYFSLISPYPERICSSSGAFRNRCGIAWMDLRRFWKLLIKFSLSLIHSLLPCSHRNRVFLVRISAPPQLCAMLYKHL
jgi:hypothetical protein